LQRPDKNMFDVSNKITAFIKQLHLWKEDIANVSGNHQRFAFLYAFFAWKEMYDAAFKFTKYIFAASI